MNKEKINESKMEFIAQLRAMEEQYNKQEKFHAGQELNEKIKQIERIGKIF